MKAERTKSASTIGASTTRSSSGFYQGTASSTSFFFCHVHGTETFPGHTTPHHSSDHARSSAAVPHGSSKAVLLRLEKLSSLLAFRSPLCSQAQTVLAGLCPADGGASEGSGGGVWAEEQSARSRQA